MAKLSNTQVNIHPRPLIQFRIWTVDSIPEQACTPAVQICLQGAANQKTAGVMGEGLKHLVSEDELKGSI